MDIDVEADGRAAAGAKRLPAAAYKAETSPVALGTRLAVQPLHAAGDEATSHALADNVPLQQACCSSEFAASL